MNLNGAGLKPAPFLIAPIPIYKGLSHADFC